MSKGGKKAAAAPKTAAAKKPFWKDVLTVKFLMMWLMVMFSATPGLNIAVNFKTFAIKQPALRDDLFLTVVGSLSALLGNAGGRFFFGALGDVGGFRGPFLALTNLQAFIMISFKAFAAYRATYLFAVTFMLFTMGGNFAMFPTETHKQFGTNGPVVYGILYTAFATAAVGGPYWSKFLLSRGGFDMIFRVLGSFSFISAFITLLLPPDPILPRAWKMVQLKRWVEAEKPKDELH